jgi:hypothetical protein
MANSLTLLVLTDQLAIAQQQLAESDFDEATIRDTLEGLEGEVAQKMEGCLAIARNLEATADQIRAAEAHMVGRRKALESRAEWLKGYVKANMERSGITKIECPWFRASIVKNPSAVVIDSLGEIPPGYINYPPPPEPRPDKAQIAADLKAGIDVPGAHLQHSTRLDIK